MMCRFHSGQRMGLPSNRLLCSVFMCQRLFVFLDFTFSFTLCHPVSLLLNSFWTAQTHLLILLHDVDAAVLCLDAVIGEVTINSSEAKNVLTDKEK